jgi:rfaE bifunctional protein nucleotidyltransferase chain/domain/rfaE bifunctional protein kinase chain/domain
MEQPFVLVVGDALLDCDLAGTASVLCPDEPAPVVDQVRESVRPGGAGLAAWLAGRSGASVGLATAVGDDEDGRRLAELLESSAQESLLARRTSTVAKTRVRVADRTLLRLDRGVPDWSVQLCEEDLGRLTDLLQRADAVLVSDYGSGFAAHPRVRARLRSAAVDIPVVWDPHPAGPAPIVGSWLVTPNQAEARARSGIAGGDLAAAVRQGAHLVREWSVGHVAVTRGAAGAVVVTEAGHPLVVPGGEALAAVDTCGAGDALAAGCMVALARDPAVPSAVAEGVDAARRFLAAGGVACYGVATPPPMAGQPRPESAGSLHVALRTVARARQQGGRIVMAGGCFDLLHAGHVAYLEAARSLGDCLVVALNSDASVRALKGPDRPVVPQEDRVRMLEALTCVDAVVVFDEPTPTEMLRALRPDVYAKGADYLHATVPEASVMAQLDGAVVTLPVLPGRSSTRLRTALTRPPSPRSGAMS